jgi:cytochrome b involved in lipid metabolism
MAVKGIVYDITEYFRIHPGGTVILDGIGMDATELYSLLTRRAPSLGECTDALEE